MAKIEARREISQSFREDSRYDENSGGGKVNESSFLWWQLSGSPSVLFLVFMAVEDIIKLLLDLPSSTSGLYRA